MIDPKPWAEVVLDSRWNLRTSLLLIFTVFFLIVLGGLALTYDKWTINLVEQPILLGGLLIGVLLVGVGGAINHMRLQHLQSTTTLFNFVNESRIENQKRVDLLTLKLEEQDRKHAQELSAIAIREAACQERVRLLTERMDKLV